MKRIKQDQIHSAVGQYLKKRQYTDTIEPLSNKVISSQTLAKKVLHRTALHSAAAPNAVSYCCSVADAETSIEAYDRFKNFLENSVEPLRTELLHLMYPVFIHLFLELLCNGHSSSAQLLLHNSQSHLETDDLEKSNLLKNLLDVFNWKSAMADDELVEFREHKYCIRVSYDAALYLLHFIRRSENLTLLQIFNHHIDLKVTLTDGSVSEVVEGIVMSSLASREEVSNGSDDKASSDATLSPGTWSGDQSSVTKESLDEAIDKMRRRVPTLPSVLLYHCTSKQGQASAEFSADSTLMSAGFEDSSVHVWSLDGTTLEQKDSDISIAHTYVYGDTQEDYLRRINKSCSDHGHMIMRGHAGVVYAVKLSKDKSHMLSASEDTTIHFWNLETFSSQVIYKGHTAPIWDLDISSVPTYFITSSKDRTAKLWSMDRTYPLRNFLGHMQDVDCVRFHPNGNYAATGSCDKTVRLWSVQDGKPVRLFQGHRATVMSVAFSHNGKLLATAGEDRHIKIWDLNAGSLLKNLRGHTDTIHTLTFSKDDSTLASSGLDECIKLWDVRSEYISAKSADSTSDLLCSYAIKGTTSLQLQFTNRNVLMAATVDLV